jgi:hypothetical protein
VESQIRTKTARHPIHRHACPDGYGSGAEMFICMTSYETCEKDDTGERERVAHKNKICVARVGDVNEV